MTQQTMRLPGAGLGIAGAAPPRTGMVAACAALVRRWHQRARQRRALAALSPAHLRDIGVGPEAARAESSKPFWRR